MADLSRLFSLAVHHKRISIQPPYIYVHVINHTQRSDAMLHRVLPTHRERYCLTVWLDGEEGTVNGDEDVQVRMRRFVYVYIYIDRSNTVSSDSTTQRNTTKQQLRLSPTEAADPAALAARLRLHPSQRVLSRPVHAEDYEASLRECMVEGTPGTCVVCTYIHVSMTHIDISHVLYTCSFGQAPPKCSRRTRPTWRRSRRARRSRGWLSCCER